MNSNEAFEDWAAKRYAPLGFPDDVFRGFSREGFAAGVAWKEQQDLACVEAVRLQAPFESKEAACVIIAERIKGDG